MNSGDAISVWFSPLDLLDDVLETTFDLDCVSGISDIVGVDFEPMRFEGMASNRSLPFQLADEVSVLAVLDLELVPKNSGAVDIESTSSLPPVEKSCELDIVSTYASVRCTGSTNSLAIVLDSATECCSSLEGCLLEGR